MEKICGIYKITSPSGKVYIGQSENIYKRWKVYKKLACKTQVKLYNSLNKYGFENHIFEILEECEESFLSEREVFYESEYNPLLNTAPCGNKPPKNNKESFIKRFGEEEGTKKWNNYIENKVRKATGRTAWNKNLKGEKSHSYGRKISKESSEKSIKNRRRDKYFQFEEHGILINIWENKSAIGQKITSTTSIDNIICSRGFIWISESNLLKIPADKIEEALKKKRATPKIISSEERERLSKLMKNIGSNPEYQKKSKQKRVETIKNMTQEEKNRLTAHLNLNKDKSFLKKKVNQYSLEGDFIKQWNSLTDAAESIGKTDKEVHSVRCKISQVAKNNRKQTRGFIWKYAE